MKKALRLIAVAMITVMLCLSLASCGGPNSDPDDALAALKDNGITWAAKDSTIIPGVLKLAGVDGIDCVVSGTGRLDDEYAHITIIYFEEKDDANDAWEKIQKKSEEQKENADEDAEWVCKKSGKMIYYGTVAAVNAAK